MGAQEWQKNLRLKAIMDEAGVRPTGLSKRLKDYRPRDGSAPVKTSHTNLAKYLSGETARPDDRTCNALCAVLGELVGRPLSLPDIGYEEAVEAPAGELVYPDSLAESVDAIGGLVELPVHASLLLCPPAWADLLVKAMFGREPGAESPVGGRMNDIEVQAARDALDMFSSFDYRYGGGQSRSLVAKYLESTVVPNLRSTNPETPLGKEYFTLAAALTRLAGWTAYDVGEHGLAQRYLFHGFKLARAAKDFALCGRMLAGMSHQANFLGHYQDAVHLARGAAHISLGHATPTAMALFHAMEARGLASLGDEKGVTQALSMAEGYLARGNSELDPEWIKYFDEAELHAEYAHCFRDLGKPELAMNYAQSSIAEAGSLYVRSVLFVRTVFATAQIQSRELDEAIDIGIDIVDCVAGLNSHRLVCYLADFNTRLRQAAPSDDSRALRFSSYAYEKLGSKGFPVSASTVA
ncbi:hypothetical protein [Nocardia sp. NPDC004711]